MKTQIKHKFIKILENSDLSERRLPLIEAKSTSEGPSVWLTACAHGDELGGMVIIQEIFKRIQKQGLLTGSVNAFPLLNPMGFETKSRLIPLSEEDLNRSFPGSEEGSLAQRITSKIFKTIINTNPAIVLDLHNDWKKSIPYTILDPYPGPKHSQVYEKSKLFAQKLGFITISEQKKGIDAYNWNNTLSGSLLLKHIPALTLEIGESRVVNEKNVETGVMAIWNILSHLGMTESIEEPYIFKTPKEFKGKILKYSQHPLTSTSGVIRFLAEPGDIVKKGQIVAKIYNAFGEKQETLFALRDGIVLGHEDSSAGFPGLPVIVFGVI